MKLHKNIFLRALIISSVMLLPALSSAHAVTGSHAVTMNYQGGWLATTNYHEGSVVTLNKQTYYALLGSNFNGSNFNKNPVTRTDFWRAIGTIGNTLASGTGGPVSTVGNVSDFYIDTTNKRIYGPKTASGWPTAFVSMVGIQGGIGAQGIRGLTGATGAKGSQGAQGSIGFTGATGANGAEGAKGLKGDTGAPGTPTSGIDKGDMQYWNGTTWVMIPVGDHNTILKNCNGVPTWVVANCSGFNIGDTGPAGGKVFYTNNGVHGLEAAPVDQANAEWGCRGTPIADTSEEIGTGAANTAKIIAGCADANTAAKVADAYSLNGYDDWYLPSKEELDLLYDQKTVVGGFASSNYWSSTDGERNFAWMQAFDNGQQLYNDKGVSLPVRAVRAF